MKNNLFTLDSEFFFWTLRKRLAFTRKGSSMAREWDTLLSFSHCSQSRITWRVGDNKGVGRKRTPGITNASDKAHHVQDTGVKGHGSFTIIVSRFSLFASLRLSSLFRPPFLDAFDAGPPRQTTYTRGNNKRKTREKETNDKKELFSRQKPRHFLWNLVDAV